MAGRGIKTILTQDQIDTAMDMAINGKGLPEILKTIGVDAVTFSKIKDRDPEFGKNFDLSRAEGLEHLADSLLTVVDERPDVQKARVHSENVKWILAKRKPQIYGDRIDLNINQTVDIGSALIEARKRALPGATPMREVIEVLDVSHTDSQSVPSETKDANDKKDDDIFS